MTSVLNVLKSVSAISIAALSLLALSQAHGAQRGSDAAGIALLNIDARVLADDTRPSIALLNMDGRFMDDDTRPGIALLNMDGRLMADDSRPSIALLNMDGRFMNDDTRPSIALLNMDGRLMADDVCTVEVELAFASEFSGAGLFIEGGDFCGGERAYVPASAFEDDIVTITLSAQSTLGAQVAELILDEGFDLLDVDMDAILAASRRVSLGRKDSLDVALDAMDLGLFRFNNDACGADPTGIQGLADALCRSL